MKARRLTLAFAAAASAAALVSAHAQEKTAAAAASADGAKPKKVPQEELNQLKQDVRNIKNLDEAIDHLNKVARSNEAADKGLSRLNTDKLKDLKDIKSLEDAKTKARELEGKLSPEERAKLEKLKETVGAEAKAMVDEERKKRAAEKPSASRPDGAAAAPQTAPAASSFDSVPAPKPVAGIAPLKKDIKAGYGIDGEEMIMPMTRDPNDVSKALPPSDLRARTMIAKRNVHVRTPNLALDADRVEAIMPPGGSGAVGLGVPSGAPARKTKKVDPVNPGAAEAEGGDLPFERVIATGRVVVARYDAKGILQTGKGGRVTYDKASGDMVLEEWPEAQHGDDVLVATRKDAKIILNPNKTTRFEGCKLIQASEKKTPPATAAQ